MLKTYFCSFFFTTIIAAPATAARPRMAKRGVDSPVAGLLTEEELLEEELEEEELLSLSLSVQPAIVKLIKRARASPRAVIFTDFI